MVIFSVMNYKTIGNSHQVVVRSIANDVYANSLHLLWKLAS